MADGLTVKLGTDGTTWPVSATGVRSGDIYYVGYRPELDESRPGVLTLEMSNQDRKWDPDYTGSPLNGYVDAGIFIQVVHEVNGVQYVVFTGIIDSIELSYLPGDHDSIATIQADDTGVSLAQKPLPSAYLNAIGNPTFYLPLNEDADQRQTLDAIHANAFGGVWAGIPPQSVDVMPSSKGGKQFSLASTGLVLPKFVANGSGDWSIGFWLQIPELVDPTAIYLRRILQPAPYVGTGHLDSSGNLFMYISTTGYLVVIQAGTGGLGAVFTLATTSISDGAPHFVEFNIDSGVGLTAYVDGEVVLPFSVFNPTAWKAPSNNFHILGADPTTYSSLSFAPTSTLIDNQQIVIGHIAQHPGLINPTRLAVVGRTGSVNTAGAPYDTPAERIQWVLAQTGLPAGSITDSRVGRVISGVREGDLPIHHIRKVAASENGFFFVDQNGNGQYLAPLSGSIQANFSDANSALGYQDLQPKRDRARRITACRIKRENVLLARYDTLRTPIREVEVETLNLAPQEAYLVAEALTTSRKDVGTVYPSLSFKPAKGNRWSVAHSLFPGQWVQVTRTPTRIAPTLDFIARIEGKRHSFGPHLSTWRTDLSLGAPGPPNYFILGTSRLGTGRLSP